MAKMRAERDGAACEQSLDRLRVAAGGGENVFPFILECARQYCAVRDPRGTRDVFGAYRSRYSSGATTTTSYSTEIGRVGFDLAADNN